MSLNKILLLLFILFIGFSNVNAQKFSHHKKLNEFKNSDIENPPRKDGILLIGSSSFTFWQDVQDYFPEHYIINRGFGGSTLLDLIYAYKEIVPLYKPKQIVIYCGENDLAFDKDLTSAELLSRFKVLYSMIKMDFGGEIVISYISMKPSPIRQQLMSRLKDGNLLIKNFLATQKETNYIDVYQSMLDKNGEPNSDLFLDDKLHNNVKGYKIWKDAMKPFLIKTEHD